MSCYKYFTICSRRSHKQCGDQTVTIRNLLTDLSDFWKWKNWYSLFDDLQLNGFPFTITRYAICSNDLNCWLQLIFNEMDKWISYCVQMREFQSFHIIMVERNSWLISTNINKNYTIFRYELKILLGNFLSTKNSLE